MSPATAEQLARWWTVQGNTAQSVPTGTPGAISVPTAPSGTGPLAGGWTVEPVANDWPDARTKSTPRGVPGGPVIDVKAKTKAAAVGKAIGKAAATGLKTVIGPLIAGKAIYDLAKELNFILNNSSGDLVVTKNDPEFCYVAPCYEYAPSNATGVWSQSKQTACASYVIPGGGWTFTGLVNGPQSCQFVNGSGQFSSFSLSIRNSSPVTNAPQISSSRQEFEDAIAAKSGWPTSSAIAQAIADASRAGESIEVNTPRLSGPASIPGPVVTTNKPDGTTETKTTTNNYTYAGDKVTYNTTTVTNIYNPVTNTTTTETSTETPAKEPEKQTECEKNPDIISCQTVKLGELTPEPLANTNRNMAINKDSGWGPENGTCPAPKTAVVLGISLSMPFTLICNLATAIRPLVIGMAWLSAALAFFGLGRKE